MSIKVVSINIEGQKHLKRVSDFLTKNDADIVCLMEVCEGDVLGIADERYPFVVYAPNDVLLPSGEKTGVAILSKLVIVEVEKYYCGEKPSTYTTLPGKGTHAPVLLLAKIGDLQIGAVHFSWTVGGSIDERQRKHVEILLQYLSTKGELVMCGDLNIPRGNEMYQKLADVYRDNIPKEIVTTLDPILHRANFERPGKLKFVVDYVFSSAGYSVDQVEVVEGVSDHCGVVFRVDCVKPI